MTSMIPLYQAKHIRLCEQLAVDNFGLTEQELMWRAGFGAFAAMTTHFPKARHIAVFCGGGNNAGDGYVLAQLAHEKGYSVTVYQYKTIEHLPPAAQYAASSAISSGVIFQCLDDTMDIDAELIVDALLGIGLQGEVRPGIAAAINQINDSELPVLAIDVPSGLDADTGSVMGVCVRASLTVTFIARKLGMMTADGPDYCGEIICENLQLEKCLSTIPPAAYVLDESLFNRRLPPRLKNSHKGDYGHVLVIGGGEGMPGAAYLAANAALRVGAGIVTIATKPKHAGHVLPLLPEAMIYGIEEAEELSSLMAKATVCILGPGLGMDDWAQALFSKAITSPLPMVIDASALRFLAKNPQHDDNWILTPHPGEAACLLGTTSAKIQQNRYQAATLLQSRYGGKVILKGVGTLICADASDNYLCSAGNPGMASAGMGDVLSGVIAGLCAQGLTLAEAAKLGVWLHATAADEAAKITGERGILASDLMPHLHRLINGCKKVMKK